MAPVISIIFTAFLLANDCSANNQKPEVTIYPVDPAVNAGDSLTLRCEVTFDPTNISVTDIQWRKTEKYILPDTNNMVIEDGKAYKKYRVGKITTDIWKSYYCLVYFNTEEVVTTDIFLFIRYPPPKPPVCSIPEVTVDCVTGNAEVLLSCYLEDSGDPSSEATITGNGRELDTQKEYLLYSRRWSTITDLKGYHPSAFFCEVTNSYWNYTKTCHFPSISYITVNMIQTTDQPNSTQTTCPPQLSPTCSPLPNENTDNNDLDFQSIVIVLLALILTVILITFLWLLYKNAEKTDQTTWDYFRYWVFGHESQRYKENVLVRYQKIQGK